MVEPVPANEAQHLEKDAGIGRIGQGHFKDRTWEISGDGYRVIDHSDEKGKTHIFYCIVIYLLKDAMPIVLDT